MTVRDGDKVVTMTARGCTAPSASTGGSWPSRPTRRTRYTRPGPIRSFRPSSSSRAQRLTVVAACGAVDSC
ncbi:hypothetical protein [Mycolicibacterium rutilum]|uniref:hypothetical protein n=1 Tax=Mycolicibacterium rutilum TaxID=370526 RepID=UPI002ADDE82A|nr:hypothetical protein [Mycolicibacterium rutilum]